MTITYNHFTHGTDEYLHAELGSTTIDLDHGPIINRVHLVAQSVKDVTIDHGQRNTFVTLQLANGTSILLDLTGEDLLDKFRAEICVNDMAQQAEEWV